MSDATTSGDGKMKYLINRTRLPLIGLAGVMIFASGCRTVVFEQNVLCPPAVEYDQEFLNRAAADLDHLPSGSPLVDMLADYSVLRRQVALCRDLR